MSRQQADTIIDRLLDENYINEERYAAAYARDKLRFSHWGRNKIRMMLRMQHIPDNLIRKALDAMDPEEYSDILHHVMESKKRSVDLSDSYAANAKIIRFALQRGFEMDEIRRHGTFSDFD